MAGKKAAGKGPSPRSSGRAVPSGNGALDKLQSLYKFMTEHNLDTLELEEEGSHVKLVRRGAVPAPNYIPTPAAGSFVPAGAPGGPSASQGAPAPSLPAGTAIKSTMMGIFYRAPSPSSPPFVKEGDTVKAGHVICMIEAMKVFNEVKADYPCTVVKVLLENGKPVKSGQDIFIVQRS